MFLALFNLQKIAACAAGHQTYLRGVSLYNAGGVHHLDRSRGGIYSEILRADVEDGEVCEIGFNYEGKPDFMSCSCATFNAASGACKHLVAALVHKYYADMVSGMQAAPTIDLTATARTDDIASRMLRRYTEREAASLAARTAAPDQLLRLLPSLYIHGQSAELRLSVRGPRDYAVRDLRAFAQAVVDNETVSYGKALTFFHHPDSFVPEDRALLRFLIGQIPPAVRGTVGGHAIRELPLPPVALDAFFSMMRERPVTCHAYGKERQVLLHRGDPPVTMQIAREKGGYLLTVSSPPLTLLGNRRRYVLTEDTLYGCSSAFSDSVGGLLDAMQASRGRLFVAEDDMATFCGGALKAIEPYVTLLGEVEALKAYRPAPMEAELYLDAPAHNTVAAKLLFRYGDRFVTAFTDDPLDGVTRDTMAEYRLQLIVQKLLTVPEDRSGRLTLDGDDETLFQFMTEGLQMLGQHMTVYATDRVSALGVAPPPRIRVGISMQSDLLDLTVDTDDLDRGELQAVLHSYREKKSYHRLKSGQFLSLDDPALQGLYALSEGLSSRERSMTGTLSLPSYRALFVDRVLRDVPSIHLRRDESFRRLIRDINAVADNEFSPPASLDHVLRNYQKTGFRWLKTLQQYRFGGILADDMGLGKTVQMISLLLDAKEQGETLPSLVVCPASLIYNWMHEFERFAPQMTVKPIVGDKTARMRALADREGVDVLITSYDLLKRDGELYQPIALAYHILDEAQYIKNASTLSARTNKAIRSKHRFALTGTPVENRLSELWSIFDFLMPGFLYSYPRFRERLERPIVQDGDKQALSRLEDLVAPFILRRLKKDVLQELPDKRESTVYVPLEGEQRALYQANVQLLRDELLRNGLSRNHITVLAMLTRLRQICCSPSLCYEAYKGEAAKLDACLELLREAIDGGHKVLLFSQFTSLLDLLRERLQKEQIPFYELRGSTPKEERVGLADAFNRDDTPVFLISLKAGGTGLNLTGADVVIHFDPWWNVSAQNQATDRAHRIGQTQTVQVYKLIARDTVEEKILRMQERKQALADAVVHEGEGMLSRLTAEELLSILEL